MATSSSWMRVEIDDPPVCDVIAKKSYFSKNMVEAKPRKRSLNYKIFLFSPTSIWLKRTFSEHLRTSRPCWTVKRISILFWKRRQLERDLICFIYLFETWRLIFQHYVVQHISEIWLHLEKKCIFCGFFLNSGYFFSIFIIIATMFSIFFSLCCFLGLSSFRTEVVYLKFVSEPWVVQV